MFDNTIQQPDAMVDWASPLNRDFGPNRGLVMRLLTLSQGGNRWRDIAGQNHGTLTNGPKWATPRSGAFGGLLLDATDDYVDVGTAGMLTDNMPFSIAWWECIKSVGGTYPMRMRLQTGSGGTGNSFGVFRSSDVSYRHLSWGKYNGTGTKHRAPNVSSIAASVGAWKHFALVSSEGPTSNSSASYAVYENGTESTGLTNNAGLSVQAAVNRIGYDGVLSAANCLMDDACIWNRALSISEIKAIYNDSLAGYPESLNWTQSYRLSGVIGGGGGGFRPYWARRQSQFIGGGLI